MTSPGPLWEGKNRLALCPLRHSRTSYPNLLTSIRVKPNAVVNRRVYEKAGPDGLKYYWSHSPRLAGLTPVPGDLWKVICRIESTHFLGPMNIHWIGGTNDGADP